MDTNTEGPFAESMDAGLRLAWGYSGPIRTNQFAQCFPSRHDAELAKRFTQSAPAPIFTRSEVNSGESVLAVRRNWHDRRAGAPFSNRPETFEIKSLLLPRT